MVTHPWASIRDCLTVIEKHGVDGVVVVDDDDRLLGVLDQAVMRKALVGGSDLDDPAGELVQNPVTTVPPDCGRAEVLDVMSALGVSEVPVVDENGRVRGVHVHDRIIGGPRRDNWAVVMAGGRGSRLAPLTNDIPKPMLPVAGRPILERLILHLVGEGITRIFLAINYLGEMIEEHFGDGSALGCEIEYLREDPDRPLGTGGPLRLLYDQGMSPQVPLMVMNGDLVTGFAVGDMLDTHQQSGAVATIATSEYQHQVPYGVLEGDGTWLERIAEKPTSAWPVSAGIYVLEPYLLERIPPFTLFPITKLFDDCLTRGEPVALWSLRDQWQDIGRPDELARARGQI
ncbi:nucleotidyltransferase family protein [Phytoactinopolyspora halophila]|nr:nucleotidyltransferase family protein [Phytoactinopolyspora halophila]